MAGCTACREVPWGRTAYNLLRLDQVVTIGGDCDGAEGELRRCASCGTYYRYRRCRHYEWDGSLDDEEEGLERVTPARALEIARKALAEIERLLRAPNPSEWARSDFPENERVARRLGAEIDHLSQAV